MLFRSLDVRGYRELWADWGVIGMARLRGGNITGLGQKLEVFDNFFLGGETIRGFAPQGIGPRDASRGSSGYVLNESLGAKNYWAATLETSMPFPGTPEEFGLYVSAFTDAGMVWGIDSRGLPPTGTMAGCTVVNAGDCQFNWVDDNKLRSSVGIGLMWRSPFGPLRADFAVPMSKSKYDQTQVFRFSGGTQF